jgi:GT2 family glycosyltransferase
VTLQKVSLIIATYNRHDILGNTLSMAMSQDYENLEIIVIDQTATPFCLAPDLGAASSQSLRLHYKWHPHPNLPAARNLGIRLAHGELIIFLDDDVLIEANYVSAIIATYTGEEIGGACGVCIPEGCSDGGAETVRFANLLGLDQPFKPGVCIPVKSMVGVNMSFRRSAVSNAGPFDEAFGGSGFGEDSDFTLRVHKLGYRLLLNPHIRVIHLASSRGGCSNRDVDVAARVSREQLVLHLYMVLKHARSGPLDAIRSYYSISRGHAFNKAALRLGIGNVIRRQTEILSATWRIMQYLTGRRATLLQAKVVAPKEDRRSPARHPDRWGHRDPSR